MSIASKGSILAGVVLFLSGGFVAVDRVDAGDSYCGTVFYDTNRGGACADPMNTRTLGTVALGVAGTGLVTYGVTRHRRRATLPMVLGIACVALLVGTANRLLQPISNPWCGSVVNPHRYYEAISTARCDATLGPLRHQAIALAIAAIGLAAATTWAVLRARRVGPSVAGARG